jgi:hypothetical protein
MMGYPNITTSTIIQSLSYNVLSELEHYGLGTERSKEDYLKFAEIDLERKTCGPMAWCSEGLLE